MIPGRIVLASASPRRGELLRQAGVACEVRPVDLDESVLPGEAVVGLIVVAGWWATGIAGYDSFDTRRIESFTFVGPLGETLLYFMLSTALTIDFPVGAVIGFVLGAFLAAISDGSFRWQIPANVSELKRRLVGSVLMGFGGVTALGCTIGQGLTGISTLAVGSILAFASIIAGCVACVKYQEWRLEKMA